MKTRLIITGVILVLTLSVLYAMAENNWEGEIIGYEQNTNRMQLQWNEATEQLIQAKIQEYSTKLDVYSKKDIETYKKEVKFLKTELKRLIPVWKDKYRVPIDLFYVFLNTDGTYVSQTYRQHYSANGFLATDVATGGKTLNVYAPDLYNKEIEYTLTFEQALDKTVGKAIYLTNEEQNIRWLIGHVESDMTGCNDPCIVKTGQIIGHVVMTGITTGLHAHIEAFSKVGGQWKSFEYKIGESDKTQLYNKPQAVVPTKSITVYMTHYDLSVGQTDASPCIGASGKNICELSKKINVIALTSDMRATLDVKFGDTVRIKKGETTFIAQVEDEMASRFRYSCIKREGYCIKADIIDHSELTGVVSISKS